MRAIGVHAGDEVIVPALTFAASANAAVYEGATPVFADVEPDTLLIDPVSVASTITPRTSAIVAVDYAGQPADYDALYATWRRIAASRIIADACHAPGATYKGRKTGTPGRRFLFLLPSGQAPHHLRRRHGADRGRRKAGRPYARASATTASTATIAAARPAGAHAYDMAELGYNYRLPDVQCALGMAQLSRLDKLVRPASTSRRCMTTPTAWRKQRR